MRALIVSMQTRIIRKQACKITMRVCINTTLTNTVSTQALKLAMQVSIANAKSCIVPMPCRTVTMGARIDPRHLAQLLCKHTFPLCALTLPLCLLT